MKLLVYKSLTPLTPVTIRPEIPDGLAIDPGGSLCTFTNGVGCFMCIIPIQHVHYAPEEQKPESSGVSESTLLKTLAIITNKSDLTGKEINKL